ncbi:hypothetical protein Syn7502_00559 [Synechococcus sp. PCC 7502]|uniref:nucleotide exchange factor GrpE n=1 Tax=Synechococcus sp. PCC 7502 TaxID=1173263 RepID=UPI00029FB729|nr:helix-turn-helix domain-containing protein [Synechococcus sp. PCC 7502]AFY72713.1 hypothetical protein Syn7502_00559 [Synechococcus sp. PCC 7502]
MADHTQELRRLMQVVGISSFRSLGSHSQVSLNAIAKLRKGQADLISYKDLASLSKSLKISLEDLVSKFSQIQPISPNQVTELTKSDKLEVQQEVVAKLESMLLQLPTAAYAITKNPDLPARNLLALFRPLENLLRDWGIEAIAAVGIEIEYNPQLHQPMDGSESVQAGDRVLVRYTGYRWGDRLLYRARVSRITPNP